LPILREVFGTCVEYAASIPELAERLESALSPDPARAREGCSLAASLTWDAAAAAHLSFYSEHSRGHCGRPSPAQRRAG
ncbi:MSMEG_0565 family glycosyltransferase, partial [Dietzia sp. SLG310A2-38A2]|nr:MSMEG_0565 family glycosyltransferase [Dietzia sp. SLG310A2-38A2]